MLKLVAFFALAVFGVNCFGRGNFNGGGGFGAQDEEQLELCTASTCSTALQCAMKGKENGKEKHRPCVEKCFQDAGLSQCKQDDGGEEDAGKEQMHTCMKSKVCDPENVQRVLSFVQQNPFFAQMMQGKGKGKGKGKEGGCQEHKQRKQAMLQRIGTPQAQSLASCLDRCIDCGQQEEPCEPSCDLGLFFMSAASSCGGGPGGSRFGGGRQGGQGSGGKQQKCECIVGGLGGDTSICQRGPGGGGGGQFGPGGQGGSQGGFRNRMGNNGQGGSNNGQGFRRFGSGQ